MRLFANDGIEKIVIRIIFMYGIMYAIRTDITMKIQNQMTKKKNSSSGVPSLSAREEKNIIKTGNHIKM